MVRYYVQFKNGIISGFPKVLSDSESTSPNSHWSLEQMKLNGYLEAIVKFNPEIEEITYDNPTITNESVIYKTIKFTDAKVLLDSKINKIKQVEILKEQIINSKYSTMVISLGGVGLLDPAYFDGMKTDIQKVINAANTMKSDINALTTPEAVKSYAITFPVI